MNEGVLRIMGKGNKERLVPFGQVARESINTYITEGRPAILGGQQTEDLFVTARGSAMSRVMFWMLVKKIRTSGWYSFPLVTAHLAPRFCHPFAQPWRRPARRAVAAGPR